MYALGQICGVIGVIITIIQPQFRSKVHILICGILVNTMSALNFALIGQTGSAAFLCMIAIIQSLIAIWHERHHSNVTSMESILFLILYIGFGMFGMITSEGFVWEINQKNALELLPIIGALMAMLAVFAKGEQRTRIFLLLNGLSWVVYTAIIGATTFFTSVASLFSTTIALWKYRKKHES